LKDIWELSLNILTLLNAIKRDLVGSKHKIRSIDEHLQGAIDWLCLAQDVQGDDGVALRYSILKGWTASYPETTGYIIPTLIECANYLNKEEYFKRAIKMVEWLLSIQNSDGSFNGGPIGSEYGSFVFDTGQIIFGLVEIYKATKDERYLKAAINAGEWLKSVQDPDGKWSKFTFHNVPHVYYSRVAWALARLGELTEDQSYTTAACRNIDWVLTKHYINGWFDFAGFTDIDHASPYTHTIAYTIRGIFEVGLLLKKDRYIDAVINAGKALEQIMCHNGSFKSVYDKNWSSKATYSCLTGNAQIGIIFLKLFKLIGEKKYFEKARNINRFVCSCQSLTGPAEIKGAIPGSYPIWGKYQRFAYPNWATKFFIESLLTEMVLSN